MMKNVIILSILIIIIISLVNIFYNPIETIELETFTSKGEQYDFIKGNFSVKLPFGWEIYESKFDKELAFFNVLNSEENQQIDKITIGFREFEPDSNVNNVTIIDTFKLNCNSFIDIQHRVSTLKDDEIYYFTLNRFKGIIRTYKEKSYNSDIGWQSLSVYLKYNKLHYSFTLSSGLNKQNLSIDIFFQTLCSFKTIPPSDSI